MTEWQRVVKDLEADGVLLVQDGNHGEYRPRPTEFGDVGTSFIRAADMNNGRLLFKSAQKINQAARERVRKGIGAPCDVILSHKGTVGKVAFASADSPPFVCSPQTTFWRSLDREVIDPRYLYAYLQSEPFKAQLRARENESDMAAYVSLTEQRKLIITVPPLDVQRAVAGVLGTLDDKIAVNERIAATALNLGEALYHRAAESSQGSAALGDLIDLKYGKSLPAARRENGPVPVFGSGGVSGSHTNSLVSGPGVVVGRKGTVGAVYWSQGDFFPIDTTFYVSLKSPSFPMEYIYFALRELGLEHMNSDSAVPGLNRSNALALQVDTPAPVHMARFTQQVRQLFDLKNRHEKENGSLAALRDTLLPQLMSGKLRIRDAEKIVEDAV